MSSYHEEARRRIREMRGGPLLTPTQIEERLAEELAEEERIAEERAKYIVKLAVFDSEWDVDEYDDIGEFSLTAGESLVITDLEKRTIGLYASGGWLKVAVSREPRLDSTDDEPKE